MPHEIFALTSRGLEPIATGEMERLPGLKIDGISYRRISATYDGDVSNLLKLRTVDDVFIDLGTWQDILPQRIALKALEKLAEQLDMQPAIKTISANRPIHLPPAFSITASFVGKRNYTTDEIKQAVAAGLARRYQGQYTSEDASEINLRIFIEHQRAYVGVRLADTALHRRGYKQVHVPGSLKPPVAAAMLNVAKVAPGEAVLDPFCGAGTILIETALQGSRAYGGDRQAEALRAAKTNAALAGVQIRLQVWDTQHLPLRDDSIDKIVTNLPWGRQVNVDEDLVMFYRNICGEMERVLMTGGQIVLLTNLPQLVCFNRLEIKTEMEISLFGMNPTILEFSSSL